MKSYYMCGRLAEPSRVKDSMEVNFSNTAMYRQTNGCDTGMSSLFGDARALLLYRLSLYSFSFFTSLELLEELLRLEVLGDGLVVPGDHLVDLLLPAALRVLAVAHRHEELTQRRLHHRQKVVGHLNIN